MLSSTIVAGHRHYFKVVSLILCILLAFDLVPVKAYAETENIYTVYVNGKKLVLDEECSWSGVSSSGKALLTESDGAYTLYLDNATIKSKKIIADHMSAGIYADVDLTIVLTGANSISIVSDYTYTMTGIYVEGNLTIRTATAGSRLTIHNGACKASRGIYAAGSFTNHSSLDISVDDCGADAYGIKAGNGMTNDGKITVQAGSAGIVKELCGIDVAEGDLVNQGQLEVTTTNAKQKISGIRVEKGNLTSSGSLKATVGSLTDPDALADPLNTPKGLDVTGKITITEEDDPGEGGSGEGGSGQDGPGTDVPGGDNPGTDGPGGDNPGTDGPGGSTSEEKPGKDPGQPGEDPAQGDVTQPGEETIPEAQKLTNVEQKLLNRKTDGDVSGASFGKLKAGLTKTTKTSVSIAWTKVSGANKYYVYGARCNTKGKVYQLKKIKTLSAGTQSCRYSKLKKGTFYKLIVVAAAGNKVLAVSKTIHAVTSGGKYTNVKALTLNRTKQTVKKGKSFTIKVTKTTKFSSKLKSAAHRAVKYETSNKKIASVSAKGVVKGVKKGKCTIYAYAQDGKYRSVAVTVK